MKDSLRLGIAGLVGSILTVGGVAVMPKDSTPVLPEDFDISQYIDVDELRGEDGLVGASGRNGRDGVNGTNGTNGQDGLDGIDGKDGAPASFDIGSLADAVVDELEDREDRSAFSFSGEEGDSSFTFEVTDSDSYEFKIRHFGSGDFDVSLEDEDGNVTTLVNSEGHVNLTITRSLSEGDYEVRVSADGDFKVDIVQK